MHLKSVQPESEIKQPTETFSTGIFTAVAVEKRPKLIWQRNTLLYEVMSALTNINTYVNSISYTNLSPRYVKQPHSWGAELLS